MSRKNKTPQGENESQVEQARNDLFSHIHRCGVLRATEEQQNEWLADTVEYIGECYPALGEEQLEELKAIGLRFCRPVIQHGAEHTAVDSPADAGEPQADDSEEPATAEASAA